MNLPKQHGKWIVVVVVVVLKACGHRPRLERTAKRSGDPGLIGQIIDSDKLSFHQMMTCGIPVQLN